MKPLFVIMVTFRRFEQFKRTVESLVPTLPSGSKLCIVYNSEGRHESDSQYSDYFGQLSTMERFASEDLKLAVLGTGTNDGWGDSMNEGLDLYSDWKEYDYMLESNNDVDYNVLDWFEKAQGYMIMYPEIGILGLWKHPYHGVRQTLPTGLVIKDDMPATAWLMRSKDLVEFLPFPEHGPCKTRGGNGEDVAFRDKVQNKFGRWVCGTVDDLAWHMDGYDTENLGKPNEEYS